MVKAFITSAEYGNRFGAAATPTPTPPSLTPEQRLAALDAVKAKFEALKNGANPGGVNQELLNFILSRPEFTTAGISTDSCVWATYTDGVELIVVNNREPDLPASSTPASSSEVAQSRLASPQPENLPQSPKARLYFTLGRLFSNPVPDISNWLTAQNYVPINEAATVENLRHVGGDGVFFFEGHGGTAETAAGNAYALMTSDVPNATRDKELAADLVPKPGSKNRVVYSVNIVDVKDGKILTDEFYGITSQFIGTIGANSVRAALSSSPPVVVPVKGLWSETRSKKGASVYAGWTDAVNGSVIFEASRFVFDRLLGANKIYPEGDGFKQRPFDYLSVAVDLPLHGLGHDSQSGADLAFTGFPTNGNFETLLAPSIWFMQVDEYSKLLTLQGEFGEDPGQNNRAVLIGGKSLNVLTWANTDLGRHTGIRPRIFGRGHRYSTPAKAILPISLNGAISRTVTGKGSLKQTTTYHIRIRADIRLGRNHIHGCQTSSLTGPWWRRKIQVAPTSAVGHSTGRSGISTSVCTKWFGAG
jgi:hypothetical protein